MDRALGHPLAAVLAKQERSAAWLSKKCGYDASYAHKVMSGDRTPSPDFRARAARILDVPESELFPDADVAEASAA
jgi:transcriptional regulator with XRE-family HTH domain